MSEIVARDRRPHVGDILRAIGYAHVAFWAILYSFHPSVQVLNTTEPYTRLVWLGVTGFGGIVACIGALTRYDVKVELPGILFLAVGPLFYSVVNIWFFFIPDPGVPDPFMRLAISALYVGLTILLLPRALDLYSDGLRTRALNHRTKK